MVFAEVTGCIHGNQQMPVHLRPLFPADRWEEYGRKLTEFARYTLSQGVKIAYHHHMGTVIETEQDIDNLMRHTGDEVGLLLDTGHLTFAGANPVAIAQRWVHIPVENEHLFRFKMNADSGLRVHRFRTPQCTYSDVR
ncbi:TIM barrel protein [Aeromonas rivipollensis]|uniref:TIM barrel protein n=1 Tax=Aeromonas rivipollensis TaxID=948519 RepID=UPI0038CFA4A3